MNRARFYLAACGNQRVGFTIRIEHDIVRTKFVRKVVREKQMSHLSKPIMSRNDLKYAFESPVPRISGMSDMPEKDSPPPKGSPFVGHPPAGYRSWLDWTSRHEEEMV